MLSLWAESCDKTLTSLQLIFKVNTNGAVSFLREISQYKPDSFPLNDNRRMIAPFWADVDIRRGGQVFYRETRDRNILTRVTNEIRTLFVNQRRFSARWVMVVTWLDVAHFSSPRTSINRKVSALERRLITIRFKIMNWFNWLYEKS